MRPLNVSFSGPNRNRPLCGDLWAVRISRLTRSLTVRTGQFESLGCDFALYELHEVFRSSRSIIRPNGFQEFPQRAVKKLAFPENVEFRPSN